MRLSTFDSLKVRDGIPPPTIPSPNWHTLVLYCGDSGDHNHIHVDIDFAKSSGLDDVFAHRIFPTVFLVRILTNWIMQSPFRRWKNLFNAMTRIGAIKTCTGKIIGKFEEGGEKFVCFKLQTNTPQAQIIVAAEAVALD